MNVHLRSTSCYLQGPDALLRLSNEVCYYPDAFVFCSDAIDPRAREVSQPCLVIEVLSDSTEAVDRGDKFRHYQTLDSSNEYLLVDGRRRSAELFRRSERTFWLY